jgi:hypothetical protein
MRDVIVVMADVSATRLSALWAQGRLVLVFLRHFG